MSLDFKPYYNNELCSDFAIVSKTDKIYAHSVVLCAGSEFFYKYFKNKTHERFGDRKTYCVENINVADFILAKMYGIRNKSNFTTLDQLLEYIDLSNMWQMTVDIRVFNSTMYKLSHLINKEFISSILARRLSVGWLLISLLSDSNREHLISAELLSMVPVQQLIDRLKYIKCMRIVCQPFLADDDTIYYNKDYILALLEKFKIGKLVEFFDAYETEAFNPEFVKQIRDIKRPHIYRLVVIDNIAYIYYKHARSKFPIITFGAIKGLIAPSEKIWYPLSVIKYNGYGIILDKSMPNTIHLCYYISRVW